MINSQLLKLYSEKWQISHYTVMQMYIDRFEFILQQSMFPEQCIKSAHLIGGLDEEVWYNSVHQS